MHRNIWYWRGWAKDREVIHDGRKIGRKEKDNWSRRSDTGAWEDQGAKNLR